MYGSYSTGQRYGGECICKAINIVKSFSDCLSLFEMLSLLPEHLPLIEFDLVWDISR